MFSPSSGSLNSEGRAGRVRAGRDAPLSTGEFFFGRGWLGGYGRRWRFRTQRCRPGSSGSVFDRKDDLPNLELVAFLDTDFAYSTADRRRHLDDGLVSLQLHDRLAFFYGGARCDHQTDQIALFNVLAQFGQFEFRHCPATFLNLSRLAPTERALNLGHAS